MATAPRGRRQKESETKIPPVPGSKLSRVEKKSIGDHFVFWRLTLVFILFPIAELFVLWTVSGLFGWFGTWMTLVEIILSALLGAGLIKLQGARCWNEYQKKIQSGESPTSTVLHGGMILVASAFLIAPGYITDCLGLLLLVPPVRSILINYIQLRYEASRRKTDRSASRQAPEVIDIGYEKR